MDAGKVDKDALSSDGRKQAARAMINALGGAVPFVGGLLSAGAGYWSEKEQEEVTNLLRQWIQMLEDELREKGKTIAEVVARIDMHEEKVKQRVESPEYQALLKKAFRNWSSVDTEYKRQRLRNILANAASAQTASDDVVRLFIDWINLYSDFHFEVIGEIYRSKLLRVNLQSPGMVLRLAVVMKIAPAEIPECLGSCRAASSLALLRARRRRSRLPASLLPAGR